MPPASNPVPSVAPAALGGLPAARTSFVGRGAEIERAGDHLRRVRLLTFTGPGGIGKTRLAIEVARHESSRFPGGIAFVDLSAVRDANLALPAIATGLGVRDSEAATVLDAIRRRLGSAAALLVLDNLEQILDAAPRIGELLDALPSLHVAATSRAPLHLAGEQEYPVAPLALPDVERATRVDDLRDVESVALFIARARSARPEFALTEANAASIARICRRLDGLPLAIELAAARIKAFPPAELLRRLDERAPVLGPGPADAPARQRTLRETVRWSFDLLTPSARAAFARLAGFAGGFTFDAASAVVPDPSDQPAMDTVEALGELVDASLLQLDTSADDNEGRYRMLETSREFALDQLAGEELERVRDRHLAYFVAQSEAGGEWTTGRGVEEAAWIQRITMERFNLRAAMSWARDGRRDGDLLRMLAAVGTRFWYISGGLAEGVSWNESAAAVATGDPARVGAVLAHAGWMAEELGDIGHSGELFARSRDIYARVDDRAGIAEATMGLAYVTLDQGNVEAAERQLTEGLQIARELLHRDRMVAEFLVGLGLVALIDERPAVARAHLEEACRIAAEANDLWSSGWAQLNLGYLDLIEGHAEDARPRLLASERIAVAAGEPIFAVIAKSSHAYADVLVGELARARETVREAAELTARFGWPGDSVQIVQFGRAVAEWLCAAGALEAGVTLWAAMDVPHQHQVLRVRVVGASRRMEDRPRRLLAPGNYEACRRAGRATGLLDALVAGMAIMNAADLDALRSEPSSRGDRYGLSPRELEVLALVAVGRTDGEIATELFISKKTASVHVAHIKDKLGVDSRVEVALIGARLGLESIP